LNIEKKPRREQNNERRAETGILHTEREAQER